jgi:hypothetical protein
MITIAMNSICLVRSLGHPKFVQSNSGTLIVGKKSVGNRREVGFHPSSRKVGLSVSYPTGGGFLGFAYFHRFTCPMAVGGPKLLITPFLLEIQ